MDKMRKNQISMEQLQTDYNTEKSSVVKLEGQRSMLERQNKELKAKLAELESEIRSKTKATIAALETKVCIFVSTSHTYFLYSLHRFVTHHMLLLNTSAFPLCI